MSGRLRRVGACVRATFLRFCGFSFGRLEWKFLDLFWLRIAIAFLGARFAGDPFLGNGAEGSCCLELSPLVTDG